MQNNNIYLLVLMFLSCSLSSMEQSSKLIPFLPYTIAQSGTYRLSPDLVYKKDVRGNFGNHAICISNGANVVLNLNNQVFDACGKKYAIDASEAGSVAVFGGFITNARRVVKLGNNNIQFVEVILGKRACRKKYEKNMMDQL